MSANPLVTAHAGPARLEICVADITSLDVDAIVNAANRSLLGGGGVDGAIHRAAGPELLKECQTLGGCDTGSAKITRGYRLKARHVIHAASMQLGGKTTANALGNSVAHSLRIASERGLKTIAFPAVGTGIAGFPMEECATIMLNEAARHLKAGSSLEKIHFVLFDDRACDIFQHALKRLPSAPPAQA